MTRVSVTPAAPLDIAPGLLPPDAILRGPSMHRFGHRAMASLFEILCVHPDQALVRAAADQAFDVLDRLEADLSRFIDNSDVSRINNQRAGESVKVGRWTMECLLLARTAWEETGGAFDISLGTGLHHLDLDPRDYTVRARASGIRIDLGGIGKGYAVDRMADVLEEWGIRHALIHGGCSSVRALEPPPGLKGWPLRIAMAQPEAACLVEYSASQCVLSASGLKKGNHIVDPRTGLAAAGRPAVWVAAPTTALLPVVREIGPIGACREALLQSPCAVAEVHSTAYLILNREEIDACRSRVPGLETWLAEPDGVRQSPHYSLVHLT